jgi:nicotinate-nucleotide adenylyltransferase
MKKIGVMGGTFDPIHNAHLAVAEEARREVGLTEVVFMPAGHPYFKEQAAISPKEDRLNMVKLAIAGKPYYSFSRMELDRPGPSYAVDSMAKMKARLKPEDELYFVMGWDSLMSLYRWHEADRLIKTCRIIASPRPGYPKPDVESLEKDLPGIAQRAIVMERPLIDVSATEIRQRVSRGLPIDSLVPLAVAEYIKEKGLYKGK